MSYTITLTDGNVFATIQDGTINTASSMTLVGKNYAGYGQFVDTNFIRLLESGSNYTPPQAPLVGQLWWDITNAILKIYNGNGWKTITGSYASATAPTNNIPGDLWFNTSANILSVWTGSSFLAVGPSTVNGTGTQSATILDTTQTNHNVIEMLVGTNVVGIVSKDPAFTPLTPIPGFTTVDPGITLANAINGVNQFYNGNATNSITVGGLYPTSFMRSDANTSTSGTLAVLNNNGLSVGNSRNFTIGVSGPTTTLKNNVSNGNVAIQITQGNTVVNSISINGLTNVVSFSGDINTAGTIYAGNISGNINTPSGNIVANNVTSRGIVSALGNVQGTYILGNGAFLTGISGGNSSYSNANVAAFLPSYGGNVGAAFITANGNVSTNNVNSVNLYLSGVASSTGNISGANFITGGTVSATGNISGNYILGNGALLSGLIAGYSNVDCAAYLAVYGGPVATSGITNSNGNGVGNIGSSSGYFNHVFAQASTALYADVAERFAADDVYAPGTVVELGGIAEITQSNEELSESVFGVISTNAAYLMNGAAGGNDTHPPVAMTGRVPVLSIGVIRKGDRLVSAGNGLARAAQPGEATAFNVIGRALHDKLDPAEGKVEAIVTIK